MPIARTITAILVALSLALAPAVTGVAAAAAAMPHQDGTSGDDMSHAMHGAAQDHASMPCCPDDGAPAKKAPDGCATMPGCMLCYFHVMAAAAPTVASPVKLAAVLSWGISQAIPPPATTGPFRPPRS